MSFDRRSDKIFFVSVFVLVTFLHIYNAVSIKNEYSQHDLK